MTDGKFPSRRPSADRRSDVPAGLRGGPVELRAGAFAELAERIDAALAKRLLGELGPAYAGTSDLARDAAVLLAVCYPALAAFVRSEPAAVTRLIDDLSVPRSRERYLGLLATELGEDADEQRTRRLLRRFAARERARIALREVLPRSAGGADVDETSRELAMLADATLEAALAEAMRWAERRFGRALSSTGAEAGFVVIGMGKLGGEELNAGSDIDLIYFYDSDAGEVIDPEGDASGMTLNEYWQRVARRLTATIEDSTEDGPVWRVDLRLRPEGGAGPLVSSLASAERYYESFGRLWERAAMLRARPVAGDLALGERLLASISSFVWRRRIDPSLATELIQLVRRARSELSQNPERDLKLGPGGIREAEFFVQALQLIWGGRDPSLRTRSTLVALARLESKGLCTQREASDINDAYLALRRAEHVVQTATGVQTHDLPEGEGLHRLAKTLGFSSADAFSAALASHRRRVERRFLSLNPAGEAPDATWTSLLAALERRDARAVIDALRAASTPDRLEGPDIEDYFAAFASSLLELAAHPDSLLGGRTRETFPGLAETFLDALFEAGDPAQAARYLRVFFGRVRQVAVYVRLVFADSAALRRLIAVLGASAFVGDALCNNPELGDMILFSRDAPSEASARAEVLSGLEKPPPPEEDPEEAFVESLRLSKTRLVLSVALADLSGAFGVREVNRVLTSVADASLEAAVRRALRTSKPEGLAVIAMGKLGGAEISYGSDLDVIFVFDPERAPDPIDAVGYFTKVARKVIRYISTFHGAGPGYELDTRLRPSGNQGLLVTSLEAFARYHGASVDSAPSRAAVWERMALVRARAAAGDLELGARAIAFARKAAFGPPPHFASAVSEVQHIRSRVAREASHEREGILDLKLGRGGILDIEFLCQVLLIMHGELSEGHPDVGETPRAIAVLTAGGVLSAEDGRTLQEAYAFLRLLELRVRVMRGDAAHVIEEGSVRLPSIARRMGMRDHPTMPAKTRLLERYRAVTSAVRALSERLLSTPEVS